MLRQIAIHLLTLSLFVLSMLVTAASAENPTAHDFAQPPASARPWVYWFPLSGNLTKEGITADLEAMQRVGIGGVLYMEVDQERRRGRPILPDRSGVNCSGTPAVRPTDWGSN